MAEHNRLGDKGEELACEFLLSKSYKILDKQWRFKHKEIDIIALDKNVLVFVEVKTRTSNYWGNPEEFVTKAKQKFLIAAAENYIFEKDFDGESRFDIVSIVFNNDVPEIEHITEAFIHSMVEYKDIELASERIAKHAHITPVLSSNRLDKMFKCNMFFKCENFQKVGAFKFRGALNAVSSLSDIEKANGVVTHSSGNHAQALSLAASIFEIPAYIVMPKNAPQVKVNAVKEYGGKITFCEPILEARESKSKELIEKYNATFIHPYDNDFIIAGQGTCGKEFIEQLDLEPDIVMTPVGGAGLLAGTCVSVKYLTNKTSVFAAEPKMADDAYRSFMAGKIIPQTNPQTIADGLLTSVGERNFEILNSNLDKVLLCSEQSILEAMRLIYENLKIVVEPSAAVSLACVIDNPEDFEGKAVGLVLSGGNIDVTRFNWQV